MVDPYSTPAGCPDPYLNAIAPARRQNNSNLFDCSEVLTHARTLKNGLDELGIRTYSTHLRPPREDTVDRLESFPAENNVSQVGAGHQSSTQPGITRVVDREIDQPVSNVSTAWVAMQLFANIQIISEVIPNGG